MNDLDLDMKFVMRAPWGSKHVAIYNEFLKKWEPTLEFTSNYKRNEYLSTLPELNKTTIKDYPDDKTNI